MSSARTGRLAPSPTGEMHLGNASSALLAWLSIRAAGGRLLLRIEDLDRPRVRDGAEAGLIDDLRWLGLDWDEGPDVGGPRGPYRQSERHERYAHAFATLRDAGRLYPCFCSRRDIAAAASAPQTPGEERRYPGTCRSISPLEAKRRMDGGARHAWRFRVPVGAAPSFDDGVRGRWPRDGEPEPGDFVVWRSDGTPAYQLAVVVDDDAMGVTEVVRGNDLMQSTVRQLLLVRALGLRPPRYAHAPLLLDDQGVRLSKRQTGITLRELREAGYTADVITGRLASALGLHPAATPIAARELTGAFDLGSVASVPAEIRLDLATWR